MRSPRFTYVSMLFKKSMFLSFWTSTLYPIVVAAKWNYQHYSSAFVVKADSPLRRWQYIPQTMSSVQANIYCAISNIPLSASLSKLLNIKLVLSLNIGTNDCKTFKLKHGFNSFRIGFQTAPAIETFAKITINENEKKSDCFLRPTLSSNTNIIYHSQKGYPIW